MSGGGNKKAFCGMPEKAGKRDSRRWAGPRRFWSILSSVIVLVVCVIAAVAVAAQVAGLSSFAVLSGSMEPSYPVGSLIYVQPVGDASSIEVGEAITFAASEDVVVTHRVVDKLYEVNESGETALKFRTKGDANENTDGQLVHYKNVLGRPIFVIPGLGYFAYYIQRPPGIYIALVICAMLATAVILPGVLKIIEKRKEKTARKKTVTI